MTYEPVIRPYDGKLFKWEWTVGTYWDSNLFVELGQLNLPRKTISYNTAVRRSNKYALKLQPKKHPEWSKV